MDQPMTEVIKLIKELKSDIRKNNEEAALFREEILESKNRLALLEKGQLEINDAIGKNQQLLTQIDTNRRQKNIILFNLEEHPNENTPQLLHTVINLFSNKLEIKIIPSEIDSVRRLGNRMDKRPVLIRLQSLWRKSEILQSTKKLKGTDYGISCDYPKEIRDIRRQLVPYLSEARKKSHRAYIRTDKLVIEEKIFTLTELKNLETTLSSNTTSGGIPHNITEPQPNRKVQEKITPKEKKKEERLRSQQELLHRTLPHKT
jgi:hypothetical protein